LQTSAPSNEPIAIERRKRILGAEEVRNAIENSASVYQACSLLKVSNGSVYKAMRRFGIAKPQIWNETHAIRRSKLRRQNPSSIVESEMNRLYVATLIGTDGSITLGYDKHNRKTRLKVVLGMTDRAWVASFSSICGVGSPRRIPARIEGHKDVWQKSITGFRALIVLQDVLGHLMGVRLLEAQAAIGFFSPTGYREGKIRAGEVWSR
jgi:hypothetical protein